MVPESMETQNTSGPEPWPRRQRRRLALGVAAAGVGICLALILLFKPSRSAEVMYQGRPLISYLDDLVYPVGSTNYSLAAAAVADVGTNALPAIIDVLREGTPFFVAYYLRWQTKLPAKSRAWVNRRFEPYRYQQRQQGALIAIGLLGTNAAPIAADLGALFKRGDHPRRAELSVALTKVGPSIVPYIRPLLTDPDLRIRGLAAFVFHQLGPSGAVAAEDLISGLSGADTNHRRLIVQTLGRMGGSVLPLVTNLLVSPDAVYRSVGLQAMDGLLPRARDATPMVVGMLEDADLEVRLRAALLLINWWPLPVSDWREKIATLPPEHRTRLRLAASIELLEERGPRLRAVLREGLHADAPLRFQAATRLVGFGEADANLLACIEALAIDANLQVSQRSQADAMRKTVQQRLLIGGAAETDPDPGTAGAGQSPPSTGRPSPDKFP